MSVSSFWLVGVWLIQIIDDLRKGVPLRNRFTRFTRNKQALLLTSLYALPLIGLLWTSDFRYAFWDLRMKLPILFMPLLLLSLNPLSARAYRALHGIFLLSLSLAVAVCLLVYWHIIPKPYTDVREISIFISHVRFSLLLILGICITIVYSWNAPYGKAFTIILVTYFLAFLYIIASMTGMIILLAVIIFGAALLIKKARNTPVRITAISVVILAPTASTIFVAARYHAYFDVSNTDLKRLETKTSRGEEYDHNLQYPVIEEGHYVMTHVAWGELYQAWQERSKIYPDSLDGRGHILKGTLIRYLASKGLRKDLDGIRALSEEDVRRIESGITSASELGKSGISKRIDNIFFELSNYRAGGNPNGHSVFQRFEFWKTAAYIIHQNFWTGVGTGDVKASFAQAYEETHSPLDPEFRLRAHNQYLTFWITYGIGGFLFLLIVVCAPFFIRPATTLLALFTIIASMSFLSEDTLESQAGVMFFVFFYIFLMLDPERVQQKPAQAR